MKLREERIEIDEAMAPYIESAIETAAASEYADLLSKPASPAVSPRAGDAAGESDSGADDGSGADDDASVSNYDGPVTKESIQSFYLRHTSTERQRLDQMEVRLDARLDGIGELEGRLGGRVDGVDARLKGVEGQLGQMHALLTRIAASLPGAAS